MASSRKKQDEKNIKLLRELASLQHNKYCFDCNQRGPTYVNVTIGSFVCTKCSGILRGLTPPHRVKSISMASFTPEEIELLQNRGNEYCRRTWLGLYEGTGLSETRDEQVIRDFMVDKYERKRYYLDPSTITNNRLNVSNDKMIEKKTAINTTTTNNTRALQINGTTTSQNNFNNKAVNGKTVDFVADFGSADIYNAINANKDNNGVNSNTVQFPFANFDNNPIFSSNGTPPTNTTVLFNNVGLQQHNQMGPPAPPEDRYAALKDLDNALKVQPQLDWSSGSNGSPYTSPTPTSSLYNSSSSHSSTYGSPNLGQFSTTFFQEDATKASNPFNGSGNNIWNDGGNPFRAPSDIGKMNGVSSNFCTVPFQNGNGNNPWVPNPFKVGAPASNGHSNNNNPFL